MDRRYVVPPDFHNSQSMANPTAPSISKFCLFFLPVYHYQHILANVYKVTGTQGGARSTIQNSEWRPGGGPRTRPFTAADFSARATYNTTIESSDGTITYGMDYPFCTWNDEEWVDNCATLYVRCKSNLPGGILPDCAAGDPTPANHHRRAPLKSGGKCIPCN